MIAATIDPLHGKPVGDLAPLFTAAGVAALDGPDRAAAIDEGLPEGDGHGQGRRPRRSRSPRSSDPTGAIDLVGATLYLDVDTKAAGGRSSVHRTGELVLSRATRAPGRSTSYRLVGGPHRRRRRTAATTPTTEKPQP